MPRAFRRQMRPWPAVMMALVSGFAALACPSSYAADIAFGEYLSGECVTCHLRSGEATGIPSITGWPQDAFTAVMNSYRSKERENPVMQTIAGRLNDEEIAALAAYFESLGMPGAK